MPWINCSICFNDFFNNLEAYSSDELFDLILAYWITALVF